MQSLWNYLVPHTCVGCGMEGRVLCADCLSRSARANDVCYSCGRASAGGKRCARCGEAPLAGITATRVYGGVIGAAVLALKFDRSRAAARDLAHVALEGQPQWPTISLVTSVPVTASRRRERGYNQSELLARHVAVALGAPYEQILLRKHNLHQMGAGRKQRQKQVEGAFVATRPVEGTVLIIDDVVTTGATLSACAEALHQAGATTIWGAAVARD